MAQDYLALFSQHVALWCRGNRSAPSSWKVHGGPCACLSHFEHPAYSADNRDCFPSRISFIFLQRLFPLCFFVYRAECFNFEKWGASLSQGMSASSLTGQRKLTLETCSGRVHAFIPETRVYETSYLVCEHPCRCWKKTSQILASVVTSSIFPSHFSMFLV